MRRNGIAAAVLLIACGGAETPDTSAPAPSAPATSQQAIDADLEAFIAKVKTVDNHTHVNTTVAQDTEADALPLETIFPFEVPVRMRPDNPDWLAAYRAIYDYPHDTLDDSKMGELRGMMKKVWEKQGDKFPEWVLDKIGTEVMLANRVAMGPGLESPRFRWVSFVDALLYPVSTKTERAGSPDRAKLFPHEDKLLKRYLSDLKVEKLPATLEGYLKKVVTGTLERQRKAGAVAVKFEVAFLRALDFEAASADAASKVYARYAEGGEPSRAEYKTLQDYIFKYIAREAGRLGLAVHIHAFAGPGNFYRAAGADPFLLEPTFNDPSLRKTKFVLIHGGGMYHDHAGALLWKPNVYVDLSAMSLIYSPARLAGVLREWLLEYPEKVLFGTDAAALGPDTGWELGAWIATTNSRQALGLALTSMLRNGEVNRARAEEIATMVLRTNAAGLYDLKLK